MHSVVEVDEMTGCSSCSINGCVLMNEQMVPIMLIVGEMTEMIINHIG